MKYKLTNIVDSKIELFDTKAEADARLNVLKQAYLEKEAYRFTVSKEVVDGNNTTWTVADLANDPEEYTYHVFNTLTGQYETTGSLSLAKQKLLDIKEAFLEAYGMSAIEELTDEQALAYLDILKV